MSKKLICLTAVGLMLAIAGSAGAQAGKGKVLFEYYENISGTAVSNLTGNAAYPDKPTVSEFRDNFSVPDRAKDNYGTRAHGYLVPPADGTYTFYIASDDDSQLWLSTDANPANAAMIAYVAGWTGATEWTKYATQKSNPVALKAGQVYFIQALQKEGGGGDSLAAAWAGPTLGTSPVVIAGDFFAAFPATDAYFLAKGPTPTNGKSEVVDTQVDWIAGATAIKHAIYMGTDPEQLTLQGMAAKPPFTVTKLSLDPGVTYHWRVDEVDADNNTYPGPVWSFTMQPMEAHNPSPFDGAPLRALNTQLAWTPGQIALMQQVYLSTDKALVEARDPAAVAATLIIDEGSTFEPNGLQPDTTYFWCVDELLDVDVVMAPGPVWSFSTTNVTGGVLAYYFNNRYLTAPATIVKIEPQVNFNWGGGTDVGVNSPDPCIPVDNFSARYFAQLVVPVAGKYTIYGSSDDGERLYLNGAQVTNGWADRGNTLDTGPTLDLTPDDLVILTQEYYENGGGAECYLKWSGGPGFATEAIPQGALKVPLVAVLPSPGVGAKEVPLTGATLSWIPGFGSVASTVFLSTDQALVAAGDASVALLVDSTDASVAAPALAWDSTYYWRVDSKQADGTVVAGQVWNFKTLNCIVVQPAMVNGATYYQTLAPYNNTGDPYLSTPLVWDLVGDLTANGLTDLNIRYQGSSTVPQAANPNCGVVFSNDANAVYKVTGSGSDIWGTSDQFTFAYKTLIGDGTMIARVTDIGTGTDAWSKGGVMIRETLEGGSAYVLTALTGGNGGGHCFQYRPSFGGNAAALADPTPARGAGTWVKIERVGNVFTGYVSADGNQWTQVSNSQPQTIAMPETVYIGLFATSHVNWATPRTFTFDNVSTTGAICPGGPFTVARGVSAGNSPLPLYAAIQDQTGKLSVVVGSDAAATNKGNMVSGLFSLSSFTGVDLKKAAKLYIGVGDGKTSGIGRNVRVADIRVVKVVRPAATALDVTKPGDLVKGFPDFYGAWPAAEVPQNAINDTTAKYLNFGGRSQPPSGFCVTPSMGATVVTGVTFTSANDSSGRDPVAFQLYGSNDGIGGPWTLIAADVVDDFARPQSWPRNTKGVVPIGFANTVAYTSYKVVFTELRSFWTVNCMQIGEVELLGK